MKQQFILAFFLIAFTSSASFGQWYMNGTEKVYTYDQVGIGTSNPDVRLHVNGDARVEGFFRVGGNTDGNAWKMGVTGNIITRNGNVVLGAVATDKIGVGTTSPNVKLHVNGDARVEGFFRVGGNTDGNAWKMGISGNIITRKGNVILGAETNDKIGIGTTSPTDKFHVLGHVTFELPGAIRDLKVNTNSTSNDPFFHPSEGYYGHIGAVNYPFSSVVANSVYRNFEYTFSDSRLKKNVNIIQNATDLINRLRGVRYDLITDKLPGISNEAAARIKGNNQLGFIAQEVKEVLPELVITEDESGLNMVSYEGVIPVLVEAFKEQRIVVEEKEERIQALESEMEELKNRLAKIEQALGMQQTEERSTKAMSATPKKLTGIKAFPNPNNGSFTIQFEPVEFEKSAVVVVKDLIGREMAAHTLGKGVTSVDFNLGDAIPGTYVYQILVDGEFVLTEKIHIAK